MDPNPNVDPNTVTNQKHLNSLSLIGKGVSPHRPDRHPEGTDSDLDKTLHICLDSQETAKTKFEVVTTFRPQVMGLQNLQPRGQHQNFKWP